MTGGGLSKALPNPSHKGRGLERCFQRQDQLVFVAIITSGLTNKSWDARNLAPPLVGGGGEGLVFFFPEASLVPATRAGMTRILSLASLEAFPHFWYFRPMTKLEKTENDIRFLSADEFKSLADWMDEERARLWDDQIERDAIAGKLDALAAEALADIRAGKTTPLTLR
jgi:hypothetical protein